jgi:hypothetical protein
MNMNPQMARFQEFGNLCSMLKSSKNPEEFMMNYLTQRIGSMNPMMANILQMAKEGKTGDIEQVARNILKEKGLDFDTEFNSFRQKTGL